MSYQQGDVVLVFHQPQASGPGRESKSRPLVVVSSEAYHRERPQDVVAALITTKVSKYGGRTDYRLRDWQAAGLRRPSVVRATLATVEHTQIGHRIGQLTAHDLAGVLAAVRQALGT